MAVVVADGSIVADAIAVTSRGFARSRSELIAVVHTTPTTTARAVVVNAR
ncbi:hypothetical protein TUM20983_41610 [Mycobacterium antarcticum]|nr:hypothetical protein TUM20983_41610 [Mycolicibacterium sp. TUM20983]GLP82527.1 hypothetical protein TUM20984_39470 [Mycolicibacterium sp. TUM20984]